MALQAITGPYLSLESKYRRLEGAQHAVHRRAGGAGRGGKVGVESAREDDKLIDSCLARRDRPDPGGGEAYKAACQAAWGFRTKYRKIGPSSSKSVRPRPDTLTFSQISGAVWGAAAAPRRRVRRARSACPRRGPGRAGHTVVMAVICCPFRPARPAQAQGHTNLLSCSPRPPLPRASRRHFAKGNVRSSGPGVGMKNCIVLVMQCDDDCEEGGLQENAWGGRGDAGRRHSPRGEGGAGRGRGHPSGPSSLRALRAQHPSGDVTSRLRGFD